MSLMKLSDKQIREPLYSFIENVRHRIRIFEELCIDKARADLFVVTDGVLTGYEIKSDLDSYARLKKQMLAYNRFCDYCYVVIGRSHEKSIFERIAEFWGVLAVSTDENGFKVEVLRPATQNPKAKLNSKLKLLWRRELVNISFRNGFGKCSGKNRRFIMDKLKTNIDESKLLNEITKELFERDYTV